MAIKFNVDGEILDDVIKGRFFSGIEFYSSLFYEEKPSLVDYMKDFNFFSVGDVLAESKNYWNLINNRYEEFISDLNRPVLLPEEIFNSLQDVTKLIDESEKIEISEEISEKNTDPIFIDSSDQSQKLEKTLIRY